MSQTQTMRKALKIIESEEKKDALQVEQSKKKYIEEFRKLKKEDIFKKPEKLSLWKKLKIMIWGA